MLINFPISNFTANPLEILLLGLIQGLMTIIFGIGGNFIIIPIMMIKDIEPMFAISSSMLSLVCSFTSSYIRNRREKRIIYEVGCNVLIGSILGSMIGTGLIFTFAKHDFLSDFIKLVYVFILCFSGLIMLKDSILEIRGFKKNKNNALYKMINSFPIKKTFKFSKNENSVVGIILIGLITGFVISVTGIGGALILIPFLAYGLNMNIKNAIGTSSFQSLFIQSFVVLLHCYLLHTVDIILSFFLMLGSVTGVLIGSTIEIKISPKYLKLSLSIITIIVFINFLFDSFLLNQIKYEII
ncbi:sulfite exporter TauE/SafE family protein [Anaplasmataceae bacterium AB001_6]|nr:sulfite exporter TauE/SafE family protein [Anaplasmataceae bacterium AB001_6]